MPAPTPQQARAIAATGHVLVMAGAGAGKTSTLVARILDRVVDAPDRVPLDRVLVVTFNEAAAAEMRHRLAGALESRRQAAPEDPWLAESMALLDLAWISTLHAFCLRLAREHFHELGLDPRFAVMDENEATILGAQVLDEILRTHYAGGGEESECVLRFLQRHASDGDHRVRHLIRHVHEYARSLPEAEGWLAAEEARAQEPRPEAWMALALPGVRRWAEEWSEHVEALHARTPENVAAVNVLDRLRQAPSAGAEEVSGWLERILAEDHPGHFPRGKAGIWRKPLEPLFSEAGELRAYFGEEGEAWAGPLEEDWRHAREDLRALLLLVRQFMTRFEQARRAAAAVDFSDLEQLALRLLWDPVHQAPTGLARAWQERFAHVLVDEYQDINGAQDRILACLGRTGARANRFLVGDVKQSIYRFRRADPRIFQGYAAEWRDGANGGTVLPLSENFRSHEAVLDFVNDWFTGLMRRSVGGVAYDGDARLLYGAPEARPALRADPEGRVELHLHVPEDPDSASAVGAGLGGDGDAGEVGEGSTDDLDAEEIQAGIVARRLHEWHRAGLEIWDAGLGARRPVAWRDMVVLHPGPRPVGERWARRFADEGVPLEARRGGFLDATEVSDLLNLARLLDNPLQDVPLLAVLRSPLVGFSTCELGTLRLASRSGLLWEALEVLVRPHGEQRALELGDAHPDLRAPFASARAKGADFLAHYRRWRELAREGSLAGCFEVVLGETGYESWLSAQPRASARLANLHKLLGLARQFDAHQRQGLFRFLRLIEAHESAGASLESAPSAAGDRVRLLSMHQSKGLEFPVVVVAGLGRRFNLSDLHAAWLVDEEYGVCPPVLGPDDFQSYPSLPRWLAARRQRREALGEQVRLLYVACTRAVERLLLVGRTTAKRLAEWTGNVPIPSDRDISRAGEPLAWLGPCLGALTGDPDWAGSRAGTGRRLNWCIHGAPPVRDASALPVSGAGSALDAEAISPAVVEALHAKLGHAYPWTGATREPGKAAVTALRRRWAEEREDDARQEAAPVVPEHQGLRSSSPDAVERGLAHHLFCELFDLNQPGTLDSVRSEAGRMRAEGWFGDEELGLLDLEALAELWGSDVGGQIRRAGDRVQRELPFTARLRPSDAVRIGHATAEVGMSDDDFQVIQGVIDLAVFHPEEIWLVDFKTDRVSVDEVEARAAEYRVQLELYAHALTAIHRRPVTRRWLYFLTPRRWVAV